MLFVTAPPTPFINKHMRLYNFSARVAALLGVLYASPAFAQEPAQAPLPLPAEFKISEELANSRATQQRWLSLRYAEFDTTGAEPVLDADLTAAPVAPDQIGYFIVQLTGPIYEDMKESIKATGAALLDYIPNYAFIVRATGAQLNLIKTIPAVVWTGAFHPAYRLEPSVRMESENEQTLGARRRYGIVAFEGISKINFENQITDRGGFISSINDGTGRYVAEVVASPALARWMAQAPDIQWIEPAGNLALRNNTMVWTVQTFTTNNTKIWTQGIHGEGQVVGHIDGNIDMNSCYFKDLVNNTPGPGHRKVVFYSSAGGPNDQHGTHTGGSSAGDAQPVNGSTSNRGIAYLAKLAHSELVNGSFTAFTTQATTLANQGARVYTNSWGDDTTTSYNILCNNIDAFSFANEDNLIMFAVTNLSSLKNPENAKNLIAVGASQNGSNANNHCSGGAGPTSDGRRKPELYAPGCSIVSANTGSCGTVSLTGTSMASPSVTGSSALVRQYFTEGWYPTGAKVPANSFTPTGSLIKAVMINSGQDMTGVAGYPSNTEGWGRVQLDQAMTFAADTRKLIVKDVRKAVGINTGQSKVYNFNVTSNTQKLAITLAFHDKEGSSGAANPVINDLNLTLTVPGGTQYKGNVFSGGVSATGGTADAKNNVERILLNSPAVGSYTVTIFGQNVPVGPQGFGLAINGAVSEAPPAPAISSVTPNPIAIANALSTPVLTINGSAFTGATNVAIGTSNYSTFTIVNDTQITVKFLPPPAQTGAVNVTVTGPSGPSNAMPLTITPVASRFIFFDPNPANDGAPLTIYMASPTVGYYPLLAYSQCISPTPIPPYVTYSIGGCGDFNFTPDPIGPFGANGITSYTSIVPVGAVGVFFLQFAEIDIFNQVFPLTISAVAQLVIN